MAVYELRVEAAVMEITEATAGITGGLVAGQSYFLQNHSPYPVYCLTGASASPPADTDAVALWIRGYEHYYFSVLAGESAWVWTRSNSAIVRFTEAL